MKKHQWIRQHALQRSHFKTAMIALGSFCTLLVLTVGVFSYSQARNDLLEQATGRATQLLTIYDDLMLEVQTTAVMVDSLKSVTAIANSKEPNLSQLMRMTDDVNAIEQAGRFYAIEVFFQESERIYISEKGMYTFEEYFDSALLDDILSQEQRIDWDMNRQYEVPFSPSVAVLSYRGNGMGGAGADGSVVVINVAMTTVQQLAAQHAKDLPVAVTYRGVLLYSKGQMTGTFGTAENEVLSVQSSMDEAALWQHTINLMGYSVLAMLLGLLLSALLAYRYSVVMTKPTHALLQKVQYLVQGESGGDDFSMLGEAVDRLHGRVRQMDRYLEKHTVAIQERLLLKLVTTPTQLSAMEQECTACGLRFPYPYFAVVLMQLDLSKYGGKQLIREHNIQLAKDTMLQFFESLGVCYSTFGENEVVIGVLNLEEGEQLRERISNICMALSASMKETLGIGAQLSIGLCAKQAPLLYRAYFGAKRNLAYTSTDVSECVCFSSQEDYLPFADTTLIDRLSEAVLSQNSSEVDTLLTYYRKWHLQEGMSLPQAMRVTDVCLCSVFARLCERGMTVDEKQMAAAVRKVSAAISMEEIFEVFRTYLLSLLYSSTKVSERAQWYVVQSVQYIEENYSRNFSIPELAAQVQLNPVYLNKVFKAATGKTVSEYLNFYRVERSLPMLKEKELTIQEISSQLGYPDVRNYMRFFKKFYGTTPSEYRKA